MSVVTLRQAIREDSATISWIHAQSWRFAYRGIVSDQYLDDLKDDFWVPFFMRCLSEPGFVAWLALDDDAPGGAIAYRSAVTPSPAQTGTWAEIVLLYVIPDCMGRGFGSGLLLAAREDVLEAGCSGVFLWVLKKNERARRFYERHGFRSDGETCEVELGGTRVTNMRMIWRA